MDRSERPCVSIWPWQHNSSAQRVRVAERTAANGGILTVTTLADRGSNAPAVLLALINIHEVSMTAVTFRSRTTFRCKRMFLCIGELPKLCEKISILMQANVLIADWYVAHSFPHS